MIFNSIRWRLQLWYGLILVTVLAGFGFTAYQLERGQKFRRIDDELRRRANALMGALRPPPRGRPGEGPFDRVPADQPRLPGQQPPVRPDRPFGGGEAGPFGAPFREFRLPPPVARLFDDSDASGFYYVILAMDGRELSRSSNAPPAGLVAPAPRPALRELPVATNAPRAMRFGPPEPEPARMRGLFREITLFRPSGETILVGRSIAPELSDLRVVALRLGAVGGGILVLGLVGGWWLATRAIRPIEDISATAVKISAGDLSQRISVGDTENELGRLAGVLNSTFARLETAFAQQQQFTSDAAHELRTPVSVMLTQTQSALSRERTPAEYRETLAACERSAQRMRRLTESLLELARLDAGQETMNRAPLDLARTAAECIEQVRPLAAGRGIAIRADCGTAECSGDGERLAQVLTNLLINAIHYNKEGGEVRVTTTRENGFVQLAVADTGMGIAPEHLPHIFERFYRADPARTAAEGRAGLGLAIAKAIVEAHGGSIEVRSEPGTGSTFTVRLPAGK